MDYLHSGLMVYHICVDSLTSDMCESSLCQQNLACTDGLDSFTCNCSQPPGVVGRCRMIPKPCDLITCQNGMCLNNLTSYQSVCLCDQGYQCKYSQQLLILVNLQLGTSSTSPQCEAYRQTRYSSNKTL